MHGHNREAGHFYAHELNSCSSDFPTAVSPISKIDYSPYWLDRTLRRAYSCRMKRDRLHSPPPLSVRHSERMRQRLGIWLTVVAMGLTWPLHIGAASLALTELVGDSFAPGQGPHLLFWFPIAGAGLVVMMFLIVGIFSRYRWAMYLSALVFLGGVLNVTSFFPHLSVDWTFHLFDWLLCFSLTSLFLLSACYLFWVARHTRPFQTVQMRPTWPTTEISCKHC